jgi:hypothetical protein
MELELETGDTRMPRSRQVKRLSDGELAELRAQPIDLLGRGWIQLSTGGHLAGASVVFARKPDGSWHICYDYRGLNAITCPAVEQLQQIDALLDGTRGSCYFIKLDLPGWREFIISCECWLRMGPGGGRRAFGPSSSLASSSGIWYCLVCRVHRRC